MKTKDNDNAESPAFVAPGLTKREHFAAIALQGFLSGMSDEDREWFTSMHPKESCIKTAQCSIAMADALIAELERKP